MGGRNKRSGEDRGGGRHRDYRGMNQEQYGRDEPWREERRARYPDELYAGGREASRPSSSYGHGYGYGFSDDSRYRPPPRLGRGRISTSVRTNRNGTGARGGAIAIHRKRIAGTVGRLRVDTVVSLLRGKRAPGLVLAPPRGRAAAPGSKTPTGCPIGRRADGARGPANGRRAAPGRASMAASTRGVVRRQVARATQRWPAAPRGLPRTRAEGLSPCRRSHSRRDL